jgi:hypothetical protein
MLWFLCQPASASSDNAAASQVLVSRLMAAPADCVFYGGKVSVSNSCDGKGDSAHAQLENCHMSGSFLGGGCVRVDVLVMWSLTC